MTLQFFGLTEVSLNFDNVLSDAAIYLDIEKSCDTTWQPALICKLL